MDAIYQKNLEGVMAKLTPAQKERYQAAVKSGQINVEARGGNVQLGGFVSGEKMRDRAIAVAKGVKGVKSVSNALFIKPE